MNSVLRMAALLLTAVAPMAHSQSAKTDLTPQELKGQSLYVARCGACHSVEYNGIGPAHKGLLGRKAGSVAGYPYSSALKNSSFSWDERKLDQWLSNPELMVPGQKMGVSIVDPVERADIVAFLKRITPK